MLDHFQTQKYIYFQAKRANFFHNWALVQQARRSFYLPKFQDIWAGALVQWLLMFRRLWVRIPALYTEWTFFTYICWIFFNDVRLKRPKINNRRGRGWPFLKRFKIQVFSPFSGTLLRVYLELGHNSNATQKRQKCPARKFSFTGPILQNLSSTNWWNRKLGQDFDAITILEKVQGQNIILLLMG